MNEKTKYFAGFVKIIDKNDYRSITRCLYYQVLHTMCDLMELKGWKATGRLSHTKVRQRFVKMYEISDEIKNKMIDWKKARENVDYKRQVSDYLSEDKLREHIYAMLSFIKHYSAVLVIGDTQ